MTNGSQARSVIYLGKHTKTGFRVIVETGGRWWPLQHIVHHSPDHFAWGSKDSAPMVLDLALSVLVHTLQDRAPYRLALGMHEAFNRDVIEQLHGNWRLPQSEVTEWIATRSAA